ncbi:MAG: tetratricopeptide repeat protein [Flavobacteriaceae bacterium]|nr:tetratricopeptide repeat protein [Flavobacteriaceae bacterium]
MKQKLLIVGCMLVTLMGLAQTSETKVEDNLIYDGNELHKSKTYAQAEKKYRKALAHAPKNPIAQHNLGNTLFDESYYGEAFNAYKSATMSAKSKADKHSALHNMGNVFMNQKDYAKAVETYKEALRNNPKDDQTRYNYALAKELLENENENQDQDNKDSDEQSPKDDSKDNKDQDQDGENKDQQDQSDKEKDPQNQQQDPKAQPTKLSPQQIKNLLEAMNNEEKKVQDKVNAIKAKPVKPKSKKDW